MRFYHFDVTDGDSGEKGATQTKLDEVLFHLFVFFPMVSSCFTCAYIGTGQYNFLRWKW